MFRFGRSLICSFTLALITYEAFRSFFWRGGGGGGLRVISVLRSEKPYD